PFFLLAPLGFVPLLNLEAVLLTAPGFAVSLLSPADIHRSIYSQYPAMVTPFLFLGLVEATRARLNGALQWLPEAKVILVTVVLLTGYFSVIHGPYPWSYHFWDANGPLGYEMYMQWERRDAARELAAIVPPDASISVHNSIVLSS